MNFLAHTFLSLEKPEWLAGNFMADFVKSTDKPTLTKRHIHGIKLHHRIDQFTDSHQIVKSSIQIMRTSQGKYSPVVVDIIYDYFLTQNWPTFCNIELSDFTRDVYHRLNNEKNHFPIRLQELLPVMIKDDFLLSCSSEVRLNKTFDRVKKRAKFDNNFEKAYEEMQKNYQTLNKHFLEFFPMLIEHVKSISNGS